MGKEKLFEGNAIPSLIVLNGGKSWYKKFDGDIVEGDVTEWMDAVKMGEGKKFSLPKGVELMQMFGMVDDSSSSVEKAATEAATTSTKAVMEDSASSSSSIESSTTESISNPAKAATEDAASETTSVSDEGVKEVFGDEKQTVHDEL